MHGTYSTLGRRPVKATRSNNRVTAGEAGLHSARSGELHLLEARRPRHRKRINRLLDELLGDLMIVIE